MVTRLEKSEVEKLIKLINEQPNTTAAKEAPALLRKWLTEPGLEMDKQTRELIEATVGKK